MERFWNLAHQGAPNECWLWTGSLNNKGYGQFRLEGRTRSSHRVAYELAIGKIPEGLVIDHLCRNRACVNPAHLEPVTVAENNKRANQGGTPPAGLRNRAKTHCPKGHPYDEANTVYKRRKGGGVHRRCRVCINEYHRKRRLRRP